MKQLYKDWTLRGAEARGRGDRQGPGRRARRRARRSASRWSSRPRRSGSSRRARAPTASARRAAPIASPSSTGGGTRIEFEFAWRKAPRTERIAPFVSRAFMAPRPGQKHEDARGAARKGLRADAVSGEERADLAELLARRALTEDAARPEAVERRHAAGGRTARENLADLVDAGQLRRVRPLRDRRPARAPRARRPDRADPGRRLHRRHRDGQRRALRRGRRLRGPLLRLHGAGRDAGRARPPQEGPAVRADRADAAAHRVLRRGRRRAPGRHRLPGRVGARHARVRALGAALGAGAADRDRRRAAASPATR